MKIITHSGSFQADDIFAVAILVLAIGESEVVRTRNEDQISAADYVVDVGMIYDPAKNRFDHHQPGGAGERPNGIPYASCGLVWKEFGEKLAGSREVADLIDTSLIAPLDAHDNGMSISDPRFENVRMYSLIDFLYSFKPTHHATEEELYKIFMQLVVIAKELLVRDIAKSKYIIEGEVKVSKVYESSSDKRVIILSEKLPWGRIFRDKPEVMFIVYHRDDARWGVEVVQDTGLVARKSLPSAWGGKRDAELQEITGVSDAVFCHRGLFMAVAKTKEGAMALAKIALNS